LGTIRIIKPREGGIGLACGMHGREKRIEFFRGKTQTGSFGRPKWGSQDYINWI